MLAGVLLASHSARVKLSPQWSARQRLGDRPAHDLAGCCSIIEAGFTELHRKTLYAYLRASSDGVPFTLPHRLHNSIW
jgi:hypothetical protein